MIMAWKEEILHCYIVVSLMIPTKSVNEVDRRKITCSLLAGFYEKGSWPEMRRKPSLASITQQVGTLFGWQMDILNPSDVYARRPENLHEQRGSVEISWISLVRRI